MWLCGRCAYDRAANVPLHSINRLTLASYYITKFRLTGIDSWIFELLKNSLAQQHRVNSNREEHLHHRLGGQKKRSLFSLYLGSRTT
jgi:hypothetical protein